MTIKTFRAKSIQEALQLVRDNLGPDAQVHGTRQVRGLIGRRWIEVAASNQFSEENRVIGAWPYQDAQGDELHQTNQSRPDPKNLPMPSMGPDEPSVASTLLEAEQRAEASSRAEHILPTTAALTTKQAIDVVDSPARVTTINKAEPLKSVEFPTLAGREIWQELLSNGVEPGLAAQLLNLAIQGCVPEYRNDAWLVRGRLNQLIAEQLKIAERRSWKQHEQQMIALVGPTGVGKTTLLGKIAVQAHRELSLQVGIVTLDTWRGIAVEQLLGYAELVDAQIEVVGSLNQLAPALQRLREHDLVLIDTAGRSPNDSTQMLALGELLQIAQPDETHLVLNSSATQSYAKHAIDKFLEVGVTHLCLSKLDDGGSLGHWLATLWSRSVSVNHLTHGQSVEHDLMLANARHLASLLLGQTSLSATS